MKTSLLLLTSILLLSILLLPACKDDENLSCPDNQVTYDADIKSIVDASCAYSGCHDGSNPDALHNYSTYDGMLTVLSNGKLETRVLDEKSMPPTADVPDGKPKTLSNSQLDLIRCWLEDGFPEN